MAVPCCGSDLNNIFLVDCGGYLAPLAVNPGAMLGQAGPLDLLLMRLASSIISSFAVVSQGLVGFLDTLCASWFPLFFHE